MSGLTRRDRNEGPTHCVTAETYRDDRYVIADAASLHEAIIASAMFEAMSEGQWRNVGVESYQTGEVIA